MRWPFGGYRPGAALLAVAVLIPCMVLGGAGLYLVRQERELAAKRVLDSRRQAADQARGTLNARLEQIKLSELRKWSPLLPAGTAGPVLVGVLRNSQVLLPWEVGREGESVRQALRSGDSGRFLQQGEREEFIGGNPAAAKDYYQRALQSSTSKIQVAFVRLALARALERQGSATESRRVLRELLRTPPAVRDEFGVPLALYAAGRLVRSEDPARLTACFQSALREPALSPAGLFLLKRIATRVATPEERRLIDERIEWAERADELKQIAPELLTRQGTGTGEKSAWIAFGDPPLVASVDTALGYPEKLVIAVRVEALLADAGIPGARLSSLETPGDLPLGGPFPGLRIHLPASLDALSVEEFQTREHFLWAALALVLAVTLFAGFLSWTDMRREIASAAARTEFVESVTHELRTPLASIRMFAETLRHRAPADERVQAECLDTIIGESERLARLVDNVLDFSKIEQGRKIYRMAPVDVAEVVEKAVRTMRYPLELRRFELEVTVNPNLPAVSGDADALEQAILNLLSNAVKYSGESRVIRLTAEREDDDVVIRVEDKGVGIAPEEHSRIFERFYRVSSPANRETAGAGLGLTLVEHIARAHGGSVTVSSAPDDGSTFSIRLPIGRLPIGGQP